MDCRIFYLTFPIFCPILFHPESAQRSGGIELKYPIITTVLYYTHKQNSDTNTTTVTVRTVLGCFVCFWSNFFYTVIIVDWFTCDCKIIWYPLTVFHGGNISQNWSTISHPEYWHWPRQHLHSSGIPPAACYCHTFPATTSLWRETSVISQMYAWNHTGCNHLGLVSFSTHHNSLEILPAYPGYH